MISFTYDSAKKQGIVSGDLFNEIREKFSVKNESAAFIRNYRRFVPQRTYAITPNGRFDLGLYFEIRKFITSLQYVDEIKTDTQILEQLLPAKSLWRQDKEIEKLKLDLRDYQREIVEKCYKIGRSTVVLATAGGKTLVIASILANAFRETPKAKALIIVPDLGLVNQTSSDFKSYEVSYSTSKFTGSNPLDLTTNVVIANLGILQSKNTNLDWLTQINFLVVDEVHKIRRGNEVNKIIKKINTPFKFGFTGTLPENELDQWNIIGKIGPILYEKNSYELRLENYVSNVTIQILQLFYKKIQEKENFVGISDRFRAEQKFVIKSDFRNKIISKLVTGLKNNVLILIDFIEHGETITSVLKEHCKSKDVYFIRGEVEVEERDKIKNLMEKKDNICVVAISKIFSTGINIRNLHFIIFAGGGKAKVKIIQSIGRGLRLHQNKEKLVIFDIADQLYYGKQHMEKRLKLYEKENIQTNTKTIQEA